MAPNIVDLLARSPGEAFALYFIVRATLVFGAAAAAAFALRRSSAAARHLAWSLGSGAALALPLLCFTLPGWLWRVLPARAEMIRPGPAGFPAARPPAPLAAASQLNELAADEDSHRESVPPTPLIHPAPPSSTPLSLNLSWLVPPASGLWLWAAWLAGAVAV